MEKLWPAPLDPSGIIFGARLRMTPEYERADDEWDNLRFMSSPQDI